MKKRVQRKGENKTKLPAGGEARVEGSAEKRGTGCRGTKKEADAKERGAQEERTNGLRVSSA